MPRPTNPPWSGSWPEPPPETRATLPVPRAAGPEDDEVGGVDPDDVRVGRDRGRPGSPGRGPSTSLMSFFIRLGAFVAMAILLVAAVGCRCRVRLGVGRSATAAPGTVAVRSWPMNWYRKAPTSAADDRAEDVDDDSWSTRTGVAPMAWPRMAGPSWRAGLRAAPVIGPTRMMIP